MHTHHRRFVLRTGRYRYFPPLSPSSCYLSPLLYPLSLSPPSPPFDPLPYSSSPASLPSSCCTSTPPPPPTCTSSHPIPPLRLSHAWHLALGWPAASSSRDYGWGWGRTLSSGAMRVVWGPTAERCSAVGGEPLVRRNLTGAARTPVPERL